MAAYRRGDTFHPQRGLVVERADIERGTVREIDGTGIDQCLDRDPQLRRIRGDKHTRRADRRPVPLRPKHVITVPLHRQRSGVGFAEDQLCRCHKRVRSVSGEVDRLDTAGICQRGVIQCLRRPSDSEGIDTSAAVYRRIGRVEDDTVVAAAGENAVAARAAIDIISAAATENSVVAATGQDALDIDDFPCNRLTANCGLGGPFGEIEHDRNRDIGQIEDIEARAAVEHVLSDTAACDNQIVAVAAIDSVRAANAAQRVVAAATDQRIVARGTSDSVIAAADYPFETREGVAGKEGPDGSIRGLRCEVGNQPDR